MDAGVERELTSTTNEDKVSGNRMATVIAMVTKMAAVIMATEMSAGKVAGTIREGKSTTTNTETCNGAMAITTATTDTLTATDTITVTMMTTRHIRAREERRIPGQGHTEVSSRKVEMKVISNKKDGEPGRVVDTTERLQM